LARDRERYPDEDDQADKYLFADEALAEAGLNWYEISNWAAPGAECAHNLVYWSQGEYLGVGCAAHSHMVLDGGSSRRWWNARTPEHYCRLVEAGRSAEAAGETLSSQQREWEALVLGLRTRTGVPAGALPDELYEQGLVQLADQANGLRAVLTRRGRLLANEVALHLRGQAGPMTTEGY